MDVIHGRVAGLDVHKDSVVACVRAMFRNRATREMSNVCDDNRRPLCLAGVVELRGVLVGGVGGDRGIGSGLEDTESRAIRAYPRRCGSHQGGFWP